MRSFFAEEAGAMTEMAAVLETVFGSSKRGSGDDMVYQASPRAIRVAGPVR